jgi:hypothetical protein
MKESAGEAVGDAQHAELAAGGCEDGAIEVPVEDLTENASQSMISVVFGWGGDDGDESGASIQPL